MTIKNPLVARSLDFSSRVSEAAWFSPFHSSVRKFYLNFFTPWFERVLLRAGRPEFRLVPRNSFSVGRDFNIFRSDLDYALILSQEVEPEALQRVRDEYARVRSGLPFVGELEIYLSSEWEARELLAQIESSPLPLIRAVRKIVWQEQALLQAQNNYHREKAKGSVQRVFSSFGITHPVREKGNAESLSQAVETMVKSWPVRTKLPLPVPGEIRLYSGFLGTGIASGKLAVAGDLVLSEAALIVFAASLPDVFHQSPQIEGILGTLRTENGVARNYLLILLGELLICRSVRRIKTSANLEAWISHLGSEILRYIPFCNDEKIVRISAILR